MGQTGFCENLRFPAVCCENLRFPAVFCENLRLRSAVCNSQEKQKSAKISENLRKTANSARFAPFSLSLLILLGKRAPLSEYCSARVSCGRAFLNLPKVAILFAWCRPFRPTARNRNNLVLLGNGPETPRIVQTILWCCSYDFFQSRKCAINNFCTKKIGGAGRVRVWGVTPNYLC